MEGGSGPDWCCQGPALLGLSGTGSPLGRSRGFLRFAHLSAAFPGRRTRTPSPHAKRFPALASSTPGSCVSQVPTRVLAPHSIMCQLNKCVLLGCRDLRLSIRLRPSGVPLGLGRAGVRLRVGAWLVPRGTAVSTAWR